MKKRKIVMCWMISIMAFCSCSRSRIQGNNIGQSTSVDSIINNNSAEPNSENVIGSNGGEVAIIEGEYEEILRQGIGELYPCQYVDVYYEKSEDYKTCGSSSNVSSLILAAGGQNIGSYILNADSLTVTVDWIKSYNPTFMIKCVNEEVLGKGVNDLQKAKQVVDGIKNRQSWNQLDMIKTNSIILFSEELLNSSDGKMAFKLFIAKAMYPSLFSQININESISNIMKDNSYYFYYYN